MNTGLGEARKSELSSQIGRRKSKNIRAHHSSILQVAISSSCCILSPHSVPAVSPQFSNYIILSRSPINKAEFFTYDIRSLNRYKNNTRLLYLESILQNLGVLDVPDGVCGTKLGASLLSFGGNSQNVCFESLRFHLSKLEHGHEDLLHSRPDNFPPDFEAKIHSEDTTPFYPNKAFSTPKGPIGDEFGLF